MVEISYLHFAASKDKQEELISKCEQLKATDLYHIKITLNSELPEEKNYPVS